MDGDTQSEKVEDVVGCHVEDAVTFWAQSVSKYNDVWKISYALAKACPQANAILDKPDFSKIYGGCFSEDRCWYRCVVQQVINNEKFQVFYIDYGNSEVLNRSHIVEIPPNLQSPGVAKKYRLWGLQIPSNQNLSMFDQGKKFLNSLVYEKVIKIHYKAKHEDGTIIAQAKCEKTDIGEEVARAGLAEKWSSPGNTKDVEKRRGNVTQNPHQKTKASVLPRFNRPHGGLYDTPRGHLYHVTVATRKQNDTGNRMSAPKEELQASASVPDISSAQMRPDWKLNEEMEALRRENANYLERQWELELQNEQLKLELQVCGSREKEASQKILSTSIGMKMRNLTAKVKALKQARHTNKKHSLQEQLSEIIKVVTEGCLPVPSSLEKMETTWTEYELAQERIQLCRNVAERDELITKRHEVQQNLYSAVEELIFEVDQLPLSERSRTLQELSLSLEMMAGQGSEVGDSEEALQQFFEWKSAKGNKLIQVRNNTDTALQIFADCFGGILKCFDMMSEASSDLEEAIGNADELLKNVELAICEELDNDLNEQDEAEKRIVTSACNELMHKVQQEQSMITVIQNRYSVGVELKKHCEEWLNRRPNIDNLLSVKKTLKSLKAQLRCKLAEKKNFEESNDYSAFEMTRIKEEIADLRHRVLQEISKEQEEYEKLACLAQKWFPELPLLYPEAGILNYMNSGGLMTCSLERELLDAEPVKELSTKRLLVCSGIQGQKVLLKGYFADVSSEAKVIERVVKYHRAWNQQKEKSGLLQLLFLLSCESDPLVYLMVPYYPGASLEALQAGTPLTLEEALKVMKGVAQGLQTLHGANIVHGSLHGNNVFAVNREQGIVGDFDFTKSEEQRAAASSMVVGTLSLVSPEVKMGEPASPASDMYAYGCLLLWLCVQNQEFDVKEDGTPELDVVVMDDRVKSLLQKLLCCSRLCAEQVLRDDCFLGLDVIPVSHGPGEEHDPCNH
ncbi:serine/threonine-protein kinase 31 [Dryobates pubescens]|uniref:serine/threonine-protein kinase 31 n=1 Tax=Dryobates pubescens TaxID=118200 RepID=UPI0023B95C72|nr:serine/threonine-protein kinase 31 [Dryobates pubescens]